MSISVPTDLEDSIRDKVESGRYEDASEVIRAAMRLLELHDQRAQELRASIAEGVAAIERGEGSELTPELMDEIEREADEQLRLGLLRGTKGARFAESKSPSPFAKGEGLG